MENPQRHVAVCAFPFGTHATPLLLLIKRLASASPDTRFSFINTESSNAALFAADSTAAANDAASLLSDAATTTTHANVVPCNISMGSRGSSRSTQQQQHVGNPVEGFLKGAPESFRRRMEEVEEEVGVKIECVISDAFFWFCGEFAVQKGLRWVPVWTANELSLSAHFHTDVLRAKFGVLQQGIEDQEVELEDLIPGFSQIRIKDLPSGIITGNIDSPFNQMLHKMGLMLPKASAVVVNSFEELSPTITNDLKSKMKLLCVGPFPLIFPSQVQICDKYNCLSWLDKQKEKSVVYISFGTVAAPPPHEMVAIAEALEGSRVPFLWSMDNSKKGHLPSWFIDRVSEEHNFGKIVPWAPQMKLLGHPSIGGFVTHCGWNSVLESIINGVPLICRPMLGDQLINERFIESVVKIRVGVEGGAFTKSGMIDALLKVLSSDEGEGMRKNAEVLKGFAEESIQLGGSSISNLDALIDVITSSHQK